MKIAINGFGGGETLPFTKIYDACSGSMFLHEIYQDHVI